MVYVKLAIFGIPIGVIVYFIFQMWATGLVIDAITPEVENALRQLDDNMVCPPEFSNGDYNICLGKNGEVIVNGILEKEITITSDNNANLCTIKSGTYDNQQLCVINDIWKAEKIYVTGIGFFNKKTIQISKVISYTKSGKYLRALKLMKYLPK